MTGSTDDPFRTVQFEQLLSRLTTLAQRTRGQAEIFDAADVSSEAVEARGAATAMAAMIDILRRETRRTIKG